MTLPAWMDGKPERRRQNARSRAQERRVAKEAGGRPVVGSGSSPRAKGDVRSDDHLIECKRTDQKSYSLTVNVIKKVISAALQQGRDPKLIIDFDRHGVRAVVTFEDLP